MKNIIIFGAPGSGKGTYSDEIVERYGMGHISTGDVLRAEIKNGTELGKIAQGYISNGQLIPDDLMIEILAKTYDAQPAGKGVIFDGFPRTIAQAERPSRSASQFIRTRRLPSLTGSRRRASVTHSVGQTHLTRKT